MSRLRVSILMATVVAITALIAMAATAQAEIGAKTVRYGPFTIPAGGGDPHDHMTMGHISNQLTIDVPKPCAGCSVLAFEPDLTYPDGAVANWNTGAVLHHTVIAATGRGHTDTTCPSGFGGIPAERIFASGNERTVISAVGTGYGLPVGRRDNWHMVVDLMNYFPAAQTVYVEVRYVYATGRDARAQKPLTPLWLDIDNCADSAYPVPEGPSEATWDWMSTISGDLILAGGHQHDHAAGVELRNETLGAGLCTSLPAFGESPEYIDTTGRAHLSSMSTCAAAPAGTIAEGDLLRLYSRYNVPAGHGMIHDVMGIMLGYAHETR